MARNRKALLAEIESKPAQAAATAGHNGPPAEIEIGLPLPTSTNRIPMTARAKITALQAQEAYRETGSIKAAAAKLGVSMSTVSKHLPEGSQARPTLTEADKARIRAYYEATPDGEFDLSVLSEELGRTRQLISRHASKMGLARRGRPGSSATRAALGVEATRRIAESGHPRGMAGKKHGVEAKMKIAAKSSRQWEVMKETGTGLMSDETRQASSDRMSKIRAASPFASPYSRSKYGRREDLGETFFRSSWEANYARYLNLLKSQGKIDRWEYEAETFWFEKIKRGVRSCKPDFKVFQGDEVYFVEVKGWFDAKSKTKLKRMAKYHPKVEVRLVGDADYRAIEKEFGRQVPHWEFPPPRQRAARPSRAKKAP